MVGTTTQPVRERLREISETLCTLYAQVGELTIARSRNRIVAFHNADGTVKDRDAIADWHVLDISDDLTRKQGEIRALQEERDMLRFDMEHWGEDGC